MELDEQRVKDLAVRYADMAPGSVIRELRTADSEKELLHRIEAVYRLPNHNGIEVAQAVCKLAVNESHPRIFALAIELLDYGLRVNEQHEVLKAIKDRLKKNSELANSEIVNLALLDRRDGMVGERIQRLLEEYFPRH
ncbi:MAG TPA: hypothetical protein VD907_00165 [Verrucomicrobiae bacterium]|nr:hypothetical protein [Verrucomicrobiae bacterium]